MLCNVMMRERRDVDVRACVRRVRLLTVLLSHQVNVIAVICREACLLSCHKRLREREREGMIMSQKNIVYMRKDRGRRGVELVQLVSGQRCGHLIDIRNVDCLERGSVHVGSTFVQSLPSPLPSFLPPFDRELCCILRQVWTHSSLPRR